MTTITVPLADEELAELKKRASNYGVAPEALAHSAIQEMLKRSDQEFQRAMDYVLQKNKELYQRLA